jgi:hypothetical protein
MNELRGRYCNARRSGQGEVDPTKNVDHTVGLSNPHNWIFSYDFRKRRLDQ